MALVKFGGGITQMTGSIGGTTFARNRYGNYARARTKPTNPNTAGQQIVRAALAELTVRWAQTLTAGQRTGWNQYGSIVLMKNKLGEDIILSGFNHYIRSNAIRHSQAVAPVDAAPVIFELPAQDPTLALTASEATQQLSMVIDNTMDWATEDGALIFFFQGQPQNAQRNFFAGPWRYLTAIAGIDPGGAATPVVANAVFAIAETQHLWVYARIQRADGRISTPFRADILVAA